VGASGWDYRAPYAGSVGETLIAVQELVLATGDYIWPWEDLDSGDPDDESVPRPSSLAGLSAAKEIEEFWGEGTHTILDMDRVITSGNDEPGAIRPLSPAELNKVFGSRQPSAADFDRVYQPGPGGPLGDMMYERWSGRSMVIYSDGAPAEVYFWGFSGD
jgi:hypothetical protein